MDFAEFRSRALTEGLRYGEDRMVFLRELAQNARDAGATRIGVSAYAEGRDVMVSFGDDGEGMEFGHARRYLFTLYASSKERQTRSAGRYGVGFWSVLLFRPDNILIESMTESGESWAVALDGTLAQPRRLPCSLRNPGTRVSLRRRAGRGDAERVLIEVEQALGRYCRYLRRNDRRGSPLPVYLNGKRIDRPLSIDGPCWLAFRDGSVEGAVGLGERPRVELYARGLLVWRGTTLDELRYGAPPAEEPGHPEGLAPVYVLNGNELAVTLERRAVVDDRALRRVRRVARRRMRELVGRYLDGISPRPLDERFTDWVSGVWEDLRLGSRLGPVALAIAVLLALVGGGLFLLEDRLGLGRDRQPPVAVGPVDPGSGAGSAGGPRSGSSAVRLGGAAGFEGPMIHPLGIGPRIPLGYEPPQPSLFRTGAVETLHPGRGIVAVPPVSAVAAPAYRCASGCVRVEVEVDARPGFLLLPVPTGHRVETESTWLAGRLVERSLLTERGEPAVRVDAPVRGVLAYRTGPATELLEPARRKELLQVPGGMRLPPVYEAISRGAAAEQPVDRIVEVIRSFVEHELEYDRKPTTAELYRKFIDSDPDAGWLEFVTTLGRGDCDVKNTVAVVMLRRAGVPARLAVGIAGRNGRSVPGMHAWIEYYDGGWVSADATGAAAAETALDPGVPPEAEPDDPLPPLAVVGPDGFGAPFVDGRGETALPRPGWYRYLALGAAAVAALAVIVALVLLVAGRGQRQLVAPGGRGVREKVAAEMLVNAIIQPEVWLRSGGLSSRRLLPVVGSGPKMSLTEAAERGRRGRLWLSAERPSLVRRAAKGGARILDASDPSFGDIAARLPGAIDLDQVARLRPIGADKLPKDLTRAGQLIEEVDRLVGLVGRRSRSVVPCIGLTDAIARDVDLSGLGLGGGAGLPRRFVAVAPARAEVLARARLGEFFPGLAAFLLLDLVLARSGLFRTDSREIRRRAARDVIEVAR